MPKKQDSRRKRINVTIQSVTDETLKQVAFECKLTYGGEGCIGKLLDELAHLWQTESPEGKTFRTLIRVMLTGDEKEFSDPIDKAE